MNARMKRIGRAAIVAVAASMLVAMVPEAGPRALAAEADGVTPKLETTIEFSFELNDLLTNHQFPGQKNSFVVTYGYVGTLKGSVPGAPHTVSADAYPYFETIRNDMRDYILGYEEKEDFYEVFGANIGRHLMERYPQLQWIEIVIHIPGNDPVVIDRTAKVRVTRVE